MGHQKQAEHTNLNLERLQHSAHVLSEYESTQKGKGRVEFECLDKQQRIDTNEAWLSFDWGRTSELLVLRGAIYCNTETRKAHLHEQEPKIGPIMPVSTPSSTQVPVADDAPGSYEVL